MGCWTLRVRIDGDGQETEIHRVVIQPPALTITPHGVSSSVHVPEPHAMRSFLAVAEAQRYGDRAAWQQVPDPDPDDEQEGTCVEALAFDGGVLSCSCVDDRGRWAFFTGAPVVLATHPAHHAFVVAALELAVAVAAAAPASASSRLVSALTDFLEPLPESLRAFASAARRRREARRDAVLPHDSRPDLRPLLRAIDGVLGVRWDSAHGVVVLVARYGAEIDAAVRAALAEVPHLRVQVQPWR